MDDEREGATRLKRLSRRQFLRIAAAMGAAFAWCGAPASPSRLSWRERRDLYPEGVASGDPAHDSVILWTRRPFEGRDRSALWLEVAQDPGFRQVIATNKSASYLMLRF